ncbi:MAG: fibronectin type III domain-containing protein, partial [Planctomycetota bacterium]|nr:fibronectin type III domain-containing protein [Planctomycetota bacterium]
MGKKILQPKTWYFYLVMPLLGILLVGCAAGLLMVGGSLLTGSSGERITTSGSSVLKRVTGMVFSQGSSNSIAPVGGAKVTAQWSSTKSISGIIKGPTLKDQKKETTTNSDGSYEIDGLPAGVKVEIIIEKDGHTAQTQTVDTTEDNPQAKGILNRKNQNKKTAFADAENDINTAEDVNEKGEALSRCHVIFPAGALDEDTDVELTPFFSMDNLPRPLPAGTEEKKYVGLAGADFSRPATSTALPFQGTNLAKPYIILPSTVRAEELSPPNIKLMELVLVDGEPTWVIAKNVSGNDRKCKYYSTGPYQGMLGPDDDIVTETLQARIKGIRPFCFVYEVPQVATISGRVRNTAGQPIFGAMVFGGGSSATTDANGNYSLPRVFAVMTNTDTLIIVNATAPGYQLSSAVAAVSAGRTTPNVNITLESLAEVAIIGGQVKDVSTSLPIEGARVGCSTQPYLAAFTYDDRTTPLDLTDDVLSVTPPALTPLSYRWYITPPGSAERYLSSQQTGNSAVVNGLFSEFQALDFGTGSYRIELEIALSTDKVVTARAGFLLRIISMQVRITDIRLPLSFDPSVTLEAFTDKNGNYRMLGVPSLVVLKLQATKAGYQSSAVRTIPAPGLSSGQTKEENFFLTTGTATVSSIWITPSPSVTLQTSQSVQFSATVRDSANNVISPTPTITWQSANTVIASINNTGLLNAIGAGATTITASSGAVTSNSVAVNVGGVPSAPTNLVLTATSSSEIALSYQDNSNNEDGFKIERSTDGTNYTLRSTLPANTTSFIDTGLSALTSYYYRVHSYNSTGPSNVINRSATTQSLPIPNAPSSLILTALDTNNIRLQWTDNSSNETGFQIRRSGDGDTYSVIGTVGANVTTYQDSGLSPKTFYYYRIYARNDSGNSTTYCSGEAQTMDLMPQAPSALIATAMSSSRIDLIWTDNSNNEDGFKIERSLDNTTFNQIATTAGNVFTLSEIALTYNTLYYYRVRAYNVTGNSNYTTVAYATTHQVVPSAPSGLLATVLSDSMIRLNWTDTSNNEDGFKIERSLDGSNFSPLTSHLSPNATAFTDTALTALTTYWYRVLASNTVGDSGFSNIVSGTTNAPPIPSAPSNLITTTVTTSSISLQWQDNSNNEDGFKLERTTSAEGGPASGWALLATITTTSYADTYNLSPNTVYYYRVYAYNLGGDSAYASAQATTLATAALLAFVTQPTNTTAGSTISSIQVQVRDASNNHLSLDGISVGITFTALNGTLTQNTVAGIATFNNLNINVAGAGYTLNAYSSGLASANSNAFNITPAAPAFASFTQQPSNTVAGVTISPAITVLVKDQYGNNVADGITVTMTSNAAQLNGTPSRNTASGVATFANLNITTIGTYALTATAGAAVTASNSFNITAAAPGTLTFVQQPTNTPAGATMSPPVTVRVRDAYNNLVPGVAVSITTTDGTLMNGGLTQNSDVSGIATFTPLSMTASATGYVLSATCGAVATTSNTFDITTAAANLAFATQPTNTIAGDTMTTIVIKAQDEYNNPLPDVTVSITTTTGTPILGTLSQISDSSGIATFNNLSMTIAGSYALSASATAFTTIVSVAFDITPAPASTLTFTTQPTDTAAGTLISPAVTVSVKDQYNNLVPSVALSLTTTTLLNGPTTVNSVNGIATFNGLNITTTGTYQLQARCGAVGPVNSSTFNIVPAAASNLRWVTQPATTQTAGTNWATFTIRITDEYNNTVTAAINNVTAVIVTGSGALAGSSTVTAVAGIATFNAVTYNIAET